MVTITCEAIKHISCLKPESILIFGRIARIKKSAPADYIMQCMAIDNDGNTYKVYTNYDACLIVSDAIAVPITE